MERMDMENNDEDSGYDEHEVECWADCLLEAEKIKADPKKMEAVKAHLNETKMAINSIQDLKALSAKRAAAGADQADD